MFPQLHCPERSELDRSHVFFEAQLQQSDRIRIQGSFPEGPSIHIILERLERSRDSSDPQRAEKEGEDEELRDRRGSKFEVTFVSFPETLANHKFEGLCPPLQGETITPPPPPPTALILAIRHFYKPRHPRGYFQPWRGV